MAAPTPQQLEEIMMRAFAPNTAIIAEATAFIKNFMKSPESIPAMVTLIRMSAQEPVCLLHFCYCD